MLNTLGRDRKAVRRAAATLAIFATAVGTQLVSPLGAVAQTATCNTYQFIPKQLYTSDYEDQWWYNDGSGDEITLSYPGTSFTANGMVNGRSVDPTDTTFVRQTGSAFSVSLVERDSSSWENDSLGAFTVPAANTFGSYWFSGSADTQFAYYLSYEVKDLGTANCPQTQPIQYTTVPYVREYLRDAAAAEVRAANLVPRLTGAVEDPYAWVYRVTPAEGTTVAVNSTVTLELRSGPIQ
jgi:hypothetical protein